MRQPSLEDREVLFAAEDLEAGFEGIVHGKRLWSNAEIGGRMATPHI
jgi:hypothetical protein